MDMTKMREDTLIFHNENSKQIIFLTLSVLLIDIYMLTVPTKRIFECPLKCTIIPGLLAI
jgi:hypothetical protein